MTRPSYQHRPALVAGPALPNGMHTRQRHVHATQIEIDVIVVSTNPRIVLFQVVAEAASALTIKPMRALWRQTTKICARFKAAFNRKRRSRTAWRQGGDLVSNWGGAGE